jgi:hypothetical protein
MVSTNFLPESLVLMEIVDSRSEPRAWAFPSNWAWSARLALRPTIFFFHVVCNYRLYAYFCSYHQNHHCYCYYFTTTLKFIIVIVIIMLIGVDFFQGILWCEILMGQCPNYQSQLLMHLILQDSLNVL